MPVIEGGVTPEEAGRSVVPALQCYRWGGRFIHSKGCAGFLCWDARFLGWVALPHRAAICAGEELTFQQLPCKFRNKMPLFVTSGRIW
ncbi:hypothetical protein [Kamptonema formosum]|uniref:hypothetical protein n=1 Tax=Kamptonema formosum TaxID=331992 RepID=UPI0003472665|nr:hypothetical protein [Oscillatoria sp. PCC 10802]